MVMAKEISRKEACEPTEDSSSRRQRRISLFRTTSLRSQMMSASSSSASSSTSSSPKVYSSPHALSSSRSIRPPLGAHQNSRLRRQISLKAFDRGQGAGKSFLHVSGLPVRKGRTSLGPKREEAPVDEFGVVAGVAITEPRETAATASSTLPLFSRRHSVSRPPSCTVSTASSSTTKTLIKHSCLTEVRKTHHSRLSSTSSATITAPSSSNVPPRLPTYSSTPPTKVKMATKNDLRLQKGDNADINGCKTTRAPPSSALSQTPEVKTQNMESRGSKDSRSSFHLPVVKNAEAGIAPRSPHTPTPTPTQGKIQATSKAMPWEKWGGRPDHLEGRGSIQDQQLETESSTGLDLLDITFGSQLLQEGDELEEMLKAEMDVLGIMDHRSSTIHKSSPPRITLPTVGNLEKEIVMSTTVPTMDFTASQRKMETIKLERDEALRQWQESQKELCQIQERLAEMESAAAAAAAAAGEQDIKRAEKATSTHQPRPAPMRYAASQTDGKDDDIAGSSDDTLTETVRLCRVENVRDSWRQAAQLAKHQIEMLEMQMSVTGYLMDQLHQLERGLLSVPLHSNDEAFGGCKSSS